MQGTGIADEINTLRQQISEAEAAITRCQSRVNAHPGSAEEAELRELVEARDFMVSRLSRLESCKRTPEE